MNAAIIYWRDIPAQIIAGKGRRAEKTPLSDRFLVAIDKAAMISGATGTDDYLDDWWRGEAPARSSGGAWSVETLARHIEESYPTARLAELVRAGGKETK